MINKTSSRITAEFNTDRGHADAFDIRAVKLPERPNSKTPDIMKVIDTAKTGSLNENGMYTVTFNATDGLEPESEYRLVITPISGNKRGEETAVEVEMPKMGKSRIVELGEVTDVSVLWKITKPDGADGIEIDVYALAGDSSTPVGVVNDEGEGIYKTANLSPNSQYRIVVRPYREGVGDELYYGEESEDKFWTRPSDIDCESVLVEAESTKISITWMPVPKMDLPRNCSIKRKMKSKLFTSRLFLDTDMSNSNSQYRNHCLIKISYVASIFFDHDEPLSALDIT